MALACLAGPRPAGAADAGVAYAVDFKGYTGGSVLEWLGRKKFVAKQDADRGMRVVNEYLATRDGLTAGEMEEKIEGLVDMLQKKGAAVVTKEDVELLEGAEQEQARARKTWDFKYISDEKMLEVIAARKAGR